LKRRLVVLVMGAIVAAFSFAGAQNVLTNPSFEVWLDTIGVNLPLGWVTSEITHPGSAVKSSDAHSGAYALALSSPDTVAFATTTTLIRAGASYDFAGYAKTDAILGGSFVISWLALLGGPVGTPTLIPVYRSSGYREYVRRVMAPDSALFCVVAFASTPNAAVDLDDVTLDTTASGIRGVSAPISRRFQLYPAQPNPFADFTVVNYSLSVGAVVSLRVYDLVGNEVRTLCDEYRPAGFYTALWNGASNTGDYLSPGIYFCRLEAADRTLTQKIILLGD
jgi:hypothetical protein